MKREERNGWKKLRLGRVESVADHSYGVAMLALFEGERRRCNMETILKLALIHDLEESITGDLTPADKKRRGQYRVRREREDAIKTLLQRFPIKSRRPFLRLWRDLRLSRSREAKIVHQLDKIEMALQAREYAKQAGREKIQGFYWSAIRATTDGELKRELRSVIGESG